MYDKKPAFARFDIRTPRKTVASGRNAVREAQLYE
jgi:hypothetical protein